MIHIIDPTLTLAAQNAWWTMRDSGLIFGSIGGAVGILGALLGVTVGLCARKGRAKPLAYAVHALGALVGIAGLSLGLVALFSGQPFHVWFHPLNLGILCAVLFIGLFFFLTRRAYAAADQNRLDAQLLRKA